MSHLTPHRAVRISPGGSAVTPTPAGPPAAPDTSWHGLISDLAAALELDADQTTWFTGTVDVVVDELAKQVDIEVARTRVRAALLGNVAMVEDLVEVDLSEERITEKALELGGRAADKVVAVLVLLHRALVAPSGVDDTVGEGTTGSAVPLPETDAAVGQVAYRLDGVPGTAKGVITWIGNAATGDDRRARAQAARDVEEQRPDGPRKTVAETITQVLDG